MTGTGTFICHTLDSAIDAVRMNDEVLDVSNSSNHAARAYIPQSAEFWTVLSRLAPDSISTHAYTMVTAKKGSIRGIVASFSIDEHGKRLHLGYRF